MRFFKPKWQHPNPDVRLHAVQALASDDADVLTKVALQDELPAVRRMAMSRIHDLTFLRAAVDQDRDISRFGVGSFETPGDALQYASFRRLLRSQHFKCAALAVGALQNDIGESAADVDGHAQRLQQRHTEPSLVFFKWCSNLQKIAYIARIAELTVYSQQGL